MPRLARCWSTAALVTLPIRMRACTPATRPMLTRFFSAPLSDGSAKIVTELFPSDFPLIILDWSRSFQRCPMSSITMYRVAILPRNCCSSSEGATSPSSWGLGRSQPTKEEILLLLDDCRRDGYRQAFTEHQIQVPQKVSVIVYDDSTLASITRPELTSVHQDSERLGEQAVAMLISLFAGERVEDRVLDIFLNIRNSTAMRQHKKLASPVTCVGPV